MRCHNFALNATFDEVDPAKTCWLFLEDERPSRLDSASSRDRGGIVLALFEGAGLVSHARADPKLFSTAIEHGARLCERG